MIEISTFCQPTSWNDRLVSLLSAVLLNPIRPDFTRAIEDKSSVTHAHRQPQAVIGVVILMPSKQKSKSSRAHNRLRKRVKKFAIRYRFHLSFVQDSQYCRESFARTLKEITKATDGYFLVSLEGNSKSALAVGAEMEQRLKLLGCLFLQPIARNGSSINTIMNRYSHVPMLLLSSAANEHFIKAAYQSHPMLLLAFLSNDCSLGHWEDDEMIGVWLARTIVKFMEAIALMTANEEKIDASSPHSSRSKL